MPLIKSPSKAAVGQNIREMVAAGHPQAQAVAAALHTPDQAKHKPKRASAKVYAKLKQTEY